VQGKNRNASASRELTTDCGTKNEGSKRPINLGVGAWEKFIDFPAPIVFKSPYSGLLRIYAILQYLSVVGSYEKHG
jgi:hypothetical protein